MDGTGDVACVIDWSRDDDVEEFTTGDGVIGTQAELTEVLDLEGNIKVVNAVDYCGGFNVGVAGCGRRPGSDFTVERIANSSLEAIVWAHEYGHNKGLQHRNDSRAVMHEAPSSNYTFVNAAERDKFQSRLNVDNQLTQIDSGCHRSPFVRPSDVRDFVRYFFIHGLRWDVATEYGPACVPDLLAMLDDPKEEKHWTNVVKTLCLIGDSRAVAPLISLLERGQGSITVDHFRAKRAVLGHIGSLVHKSDDRKALNFLLDSFNEMTGWRARVKWTNPFHDGSATGDPHITKTAAWGLGLSGKQLAGEMLQRILANTTNPPGVKSAAKEALAAHAIVAAGGTLAYYSTFGV